MTDTAQRWLLVVVLLLIAVAVWVDARRVGRAYGHDRGFPGLKPAWWAAFAVLFPIVVVPWYVGRRMRLTRSAAYRADLESRFGSPLPS